MVGSFYDGLLIFFRIVSQILTAGIAITAFSLLLYALTFNLRDRVARSFAVIMVCVVIVFTAEAIGSASRYTWEVEFWLHCQWVGIIILPPAYLHFSDALLSTTGKPSRWRRFWATRIAYFMSAIFLVLLPSGLFIGQMIDNPFSAPFLQATPTTDVFIIFYLIIMGMAWYNLVRAYRRTTTNTSRRRMTYLLTGALSPALGSFPYLVFFGNLASQYRLFFWLVAAIGSLLIGGLIVVMAYSVAFFGVAWPDRVVKTRLVKWIMRGPVVASMTLGLTTIVRRFGEVFGASYSALVPISMVLSIVVCEYIITLFGPLWERLPFTSRDQQEVNLLHHLEDRLLTQNDLRQYMEMILAAVCDRLQAPGAYVAILSSGQEPKVEQVITTGKAGFPEADVSDSIFQAITSNGDIPELFHWGDDLIAPLVASSAQQEWRIEGLLGISKVGRQSLDEDQLQALKLLVERAAMPLRDRRTQQEIFESLQSLAPDIDFIQRIRATGRYDGATLLMEEIPDLPPDLSQWVKEALTHYWGGPKLIESPLMGLRVVQESLNEHEGNHANALRSILRQAIEQVRPEGERRFTAEWILYNILEMKFLEGRKVREVAGRLALSEADLYRKQRVAIEAVAKAISEMETQARQHQSGT